MPLAGSRSDADANIAVRPDSGPEGARPACTVRGPDVLNVCELAEAGPVVLAFLALRSGRCEDQVDVLDRVAPRFPALRFAAVAIRGDHDDLRDVVRERGWSIPVGYDHDGAVANLYGVAICPTITFARRGGEGRGHGARVHGRGGADARRAGAGGRRAAAAGGGRVSAGDPVLEAAAIDPRVAQEHPGLRVWTARVPGGTGRTPRELRERLALAADRLRGPQAVAMRTRPVPWAYRVLFRHLGLDPDVTRTPVEALVLDRLVQGGHASHGMPDDALALATLETGVPVQAVDAARVGAARPGARTPAAG